MNRFSRGPIAADVQSNFVPLPIDAIAKQIERKQNQYDLTKAQLDAEEQAVLGVKGMSQDSDSLARIQNQYSDEILKGIEEVGGDYSRLGGLADTIGRKLRKDLTQGQLYAIQSNLATYNKQLEQIDKLKASGTYGDRAEKLFSRDVQDFKGTVNEDGTYNIFKPKEYVKQVNIPKVADDYAGKLADQYAANGIKFKGDEGIEYVLKDLYNDSDVRNDAEEEIDYRYGKLDPKAKAKATYDYLYGLAKNAVDKGKYRQTLSPTEQKAFDDLGEDALVTNYTATGGNPNKNPLQTFTDWSKAKRGSIYNPFGDTDFEEGFLTPEEREEVDKRYISASSYSPIPVSRSTIVNSMLKAKGVDLKDVTSLRNSTEGKKVVKEFIKNKPALKEALEAELLMENLQKGKSEYVSIDDIDGEEVIRLLDKHEERVKEQNKQATTSTISRVIDKKGTTLKAFENEVYPGVLKSRTILDQNGNVLSAEETLELANKVEGQLYAKTSEGGGVESLYGGKVSSEAKAQPHPKNSTVVNVKDDKGRSIPYYISPYNVNSQEFRDDRARYAFESPQGYATYNDGANQIELVRVVNKDPLTNKDVPFKLKMYIDGKEYTK